MRNMMVDAAEGHSRSSSLGNASFTGTETENEVKMREKKKKT